MRALLFCIVLCVAGCAIPLRTQFLNDDLFPTSDLLADRILALKKAASGRLDFSEKDAFRILAQEQDKDDPMRIRDNPERAKEIDTRCQRISSTKIHDILLPGAEIRGTAQEIKDYEKDIGHITACNFGVKYLPRFANLGLSHVAISVLGHDQAIVLVFDDRVGRTNGRQTDTVRVFMEGRAKVSEREDIYYWEILLDSLQGLIIEGGKNAGKAAF
jgi:hypothetical protein